MSQERQFGATEFARLEVLFDEGDDHGRQPFRAEREQRRRRRTGGRFSECEM